MAMKFQKLSQPLVVENLQVRNKIPVPAIYINLVYQRNGKKRMADYYAAPLKGAGTTTKSTTLFMQCEPDSYLEELETVVNCYDTIVKLGCYISFTKIRETFYSSSFVLN